MGGRTSYRRRVVGGESLQEMTYQRMPQVERGRPMPWRFVFTRWLNDVRALDRIDYVDVARFSGQQGYFEYTGSVVSLRRGT